METDHANNVTPPPVPPGAEESHGGGASGGVLVCPKCGWHFPNQNPSSRQRRAHRKICGTLPGDSSANRPVSPPQLQTFYSFVSADDHPSDDDGEFKTPSPNALERSQLETGSGGTGGKSSRSEDEVFTDAVTDFVDATGSSALGLQQEGFIGAIINHKDIDGPSDKTKQIQISEVEVHPDRVALASEEYIPIAATELTGRSNPDVVTKEPGDVSGDVGLVPTSDLNPMIPRNQINDPGEVTVSSIDDLSGTYQENGETIPEVRVASGLDLSGDNDVKLSEGMPNIQKTVVVNSNTGDISKLVDENTAKPTIGCGDAAHCDKVGELHLLEHDEKIETNSSVYDMQSTDHINTSVDKVDKEDTPVVANFASSNESKDLKCTDDGNTHFLSVNDDIAYADNAGTVLKGFKGGGIKIPTSVKSGSETIDVKASEPSMEDFKCIVLPARPLDEATLLTSPEVLLDVTEGEGTLLNSSEVPVVGDNVEVKGESSKLVARALDVTEGEGTLLSSSEVPVVGDNVEVIGESSKLVAKALVDGTGGEGTLLSSSDVPVVGDNVEVKGESSKLVAKVLVDGTEIDNPATDVSCIANESLGERELSPDVVAIPVPSPEEQIGDHGDARLIGSNLDSTEEVPSEVPVVGENLEVKGESSKLVAKALVDGAEVDSPAADVSRIANERFVEQEADVVAIPVQSPEEQIGDHRDAKLIGNNLDSTTEVSSDPIQLISSADREGEQLKMPDDAVPDSYKVPNNEGSNVDEDSNIIIENVRPNLLGGQFDRSDVTGTGNSDPSSFVDQNVSAKMVETLESDTEHRRSDIDASKQRSQNAQNIGSSFLEGVSTTDSEGNKIDRNVPPAAKIGGTTSDAEVSQKSPEDLVANDLLISAPDTDSKKDAGIVKDECTRDLVGDVSDDKPEPFSNEGQLPAKHVDTSAADISVDSNSQTDSLEGQWGSVSAVSTLSDMPVSVDAEGGSGKSSRKMAYAPPERRESDMFEAPSFMTLVEPMKGSEQRADGGASGIQNPQQSKAGASPAQAGWFPSITNVVNESEGRRKNEEIIAKVMTHRSGGGTQQQHTPLKSLLGEANEEMKSRRPKKENAGVVETTAEEGVVGGGKEWSSPDREKRKVKGRPYWTHLVCCASVN